ncbi:hypothetical protein [Microvirga arsenatis]|uniref:Uncharacterized protein n=1 Tax=Microvirga arsenatis TaxID=2692265 RepID=A0ABW9YUC0_9HYPH|nr:hypothetical protein [Microvirga arsenatis]NBJ09422.1 hypothetical protein [Microvirga arsenatis]NBJ23720.1 hypothetical protein [Microvirga arsenatis]
MIPAFVAVDGRSVSTHAALLAACGLGIAANRPVTLVRITGAAEAALPSPETMPDAVRVVEHPLAAAGHRPAVDRAIAAAEGDGRAVVLDMPLAELTDWAGPARARVLPVVPVGPAPLDEHLVASALHDLAAGMGPREPGSRQGMDGGPQAARPVPWLLGCGRSGGGPALAGFTETMQALLTADAGPVPARVLPLTLPLLSRGEAASLLAGQPRPWLLRSGVLLTAALRAVAAAPSAPDIDPAAFAEILGAGDPTRITADERDEPERLRDLADALQAIRDGNPPTPEELATAPVLDDWVRTTRPVRILEGRSYGHPSIPSGRLVRTSEVYATDGRTYARTLSRLYRLGTPAQDGSAAASVH